MGSIAGMERSKMKDYIAEQLNAGKKYNEILEEVKREIVSQMLVRTHVNQTEAARLFDANRGTMRKW